MSTPDPRLVLAYEAAEAYYTHGRTQAEVAQHLGVSRPTVSRLLEEARAAGLVTITVTPPRGSSFKALSAELASALGLRSVRIAPGSVREGSLGGALGPQTAATLLSYRLHPGDVLVVASGRTVYELSLEELPRLPGLILVPGVGGQADPEPWFQTNELVRTLAQKTGGTPRFLFAEAKPSPALYQALRADPSFRSIEQLWAGASAAILGIGAPPRTRSSIASGISVADPSIVTAAGDVCLHFFDPDGQPLDFQGSDRMVRVPLDDLLAIPQRLAVAVGPEKVPSIIAAARMGCFHDLVTDQATATGLSQALSSSSAPTASAAGAATRIRA